VSPLKARDGVVIERRGNARVDATRPPNRIIVDSIR
jgi:hypothetical protein